MFVKIYFLTFYLSAFTLVHGLNNIHEYMTEEEVLSVFNAHHDSVPEYEVVPVFHDEYNSQFSFIYPSSRLKLRAFGKDINLYLIPTDHVLVGEDTPVYAATKDASEPLGIRYTRIGNAWPTGCRTYQDQTNQAAVTIHKDSHGDINVDGIIGDHIIKPLPKDIRKVVDNHFPKKKSGFKNTPAPFSNNNENENVSHHVIFKSNENPITETMDNIKRTGEKIWQSLFDFRNSRRFKRNIFDTVYPQILIIVDYETFKAHGKNIKELSKYMAAFWNGVDLRYRDMRDPKVRLNIAGLIIPQEEGAVPYLESNLRGKNMIDDNETLKALSRYLHKEKRFSTTMYDIAVGITHLDMCTMRNDDCDASIRGIGYNGGACKHDIRDSDLSTALFEDKGGFSGINTAAHEIGHLLGAPHDGEASPLYLGGPGAINCRWSDGYLMSSDRRNNRGFHWSSCSIASMQYFLNKEAYCLRNKPVIGKPLPKILPGKLLSRDEQCRRTFNMVECKIAKNDCGALWCIKPDGSPKCISKGPPAEGSTCSPGGICLDGYCVLEPKELIFMSH